jgi:hypothetical protein
VSSLTNLEPNTAEDLLRLARRVKTQEGAEKYGQSVGSLISVDSPGEGDTDSVREVTIERLRSLQRQLSLAKSSGNTALFKSASEGFALALRGYSRGRPAVEVIAALRVPMQAAEVG